MKSTALFVDLNNLYHGAVQKYKGGRLDYESLYAEIQSHGLIRAAFAYGTSKKDQSETESFRAMLRHIGYECRWEIGRYNWNVGIAMEIVRQIDRTELIILGSGDPFISDCIEWVRGHGVRCYVYGFNISEKLRQAADRFFEIPKELLIQDDNLDAIEPE